MNRPTAVIRFGTTYRIKSGHYKGRLCKPLELSGSLFVKIRLIDAWGKDTKVTDLIPVTYLEV